MFHNFSRLLCLISCEDSLWTSRPHLVPYRHWISLDMDQISKFVIADTQLTPHTFMVVSTQVPSCPHQLSPSHQSQHQNSPPPPVCASNWCVPGPGFKVNVSSDCSKENPEPKVLKDLLLQVMIQSKRKKITNDWQMELLFIKLHS